MARRFRDEDDDDFDDEDDRSQRRRGETGGGGMAVWLFTALGLGAVVVVGLIVLLVSGKKKDDTTETPAAQSSQPAPQPRPQPKGDSPKSDPARPKPPDFAPQGNPGTNWAKAIGTWQREVPANDPNAGYPYQLEFRKDLTATAIWNRQDGPAPQEMRVEVRDDRGDSLMLVLHVPMGTYSYSFKVKPDGMLVLDDWKSGLAFKRVK
jgi:hypothetical protein